VGLHGQLVVLDVEINPLAGLAGDEGLALGVALLGLHEVHGVALLVLLLEELELLGLETYLLGQILAVGLANNDGAERQ